MLQFIKSAFSELEHVVWPTEKESKKYMMYTISIIIIMATLLSILGYLIRGGLVGVRDQFDHAPIITTTVSGEDLATELDLQKLQEEIQKRKASASGTTIETPTTSETGLITPLEIPAN